MADRRHSTVFELLTVITTAVQEASFSPHPTTSRLPWRDDQVIPPETVDEWVTVVQSVEGEGSIVWTRVSPGGRDELIGVDVEVGSMIPGRTKLQVLARLEELADVVQSLFYDPDTYVFTPPDLGAASVQLGGFSGVSTTVSATSTGHVGTARIRYEFQARI